MGSGLSVLALAIAASLPGLHAHGLQSDPAIYAHSLATRQPQSLATCTYRAFTVAESPSKGWNIRTFSIDLPGDLWRTICANTDVITPLLDAIERSCIRTWSQKGSPRTFGIRPRATLGKGPCHIRISVKAPLGQDQAVPPFEGDCILDTRPQPCGYRSQAISWPSECSPATSEGPKEITEPLITGSKHSSFSRYTDEEDDLIVILRKKGFSWKELTKEHAKHFPGRTAEALQSRFHVLTKPKSKPRPEDYPQSDLARWTDAQDEMLVRLRLEGKSWEEIAAALPPPERTPSAAQGRHQTLRANNMIDDVPNEKSYKPEDDQLILKMKWEGKSWEEIANALPGPKRSISSLHMRYQRLKKLHGLDKAPTEVKKTSYTPEEDERIKRLKESGMSWNDIAKAVPGHSVGGLRDHYHKHLKSER